MEPSNHDDASLFGNVWIQHFEAAQTNYGTNGNGYEPNGENGIGEPMGGFDAESYWKSKYEQCMAKIAQMKEVHKTEIGRWTSRHARAEKAAYNYGHKMLEMSTRLDPVEKEVSELKTQLIAMIQEEINYKCEIERNQAVVVQLQAFVDRRKEEVESIYQQNSQLQVCLTEKEVEAKEWKEKVEKYERKRNAFRRRFGERARHNDQNGVSSSEYESVNSEYAAQMVKELQRLRASKRPAASSEREDGDGQREFGNAKKLCNENRDTIPVYQEICAAQNNSTSEYPSFITAEATTTLEELSQRPLVSPIPSVPIRQHRRSSQVTAFKLKQFLLLLSYQVERNQWDQSVNVMLKLAIVWPKVFKKIMTDPDGEMEKILQALLRLMWNSPHRMDIERLLEKDLGEWNPIDQQSSVDALIREQVDRLSGLQVAIDLSASGIRIPDDLLKCIRKIVLIAPYCSDQAVGFFVESWLTSIIQWNTMVEGGVDKLIVNMLLVSWVAMFGQSIIQQQIEGLFTSIKSMVFGADDSTMFAGIERAKLICGAVELLTTLPKLCLFGHFGEAGNLLKELVVELMKAGEIEDAVKQCYRKRYVEICNRRAMLPGGPF